jgi:hypothetical protein
MSDLETEKLALEVRRLKQEAGVMGRLLGTLPLITVLVAVGTFWFGVVQFISESRQNRTLRWEEQLRSDIQELLAFPKNEEYTVSRASFLLQDLRRLQGYLGRDDDQVTGTLLALVQDDCDFDKRRHVGLDIAMFEQWPPYVDEMRKDANRQGFIIYKYFQALRHLHDADPRYFESLGYEPGSGYVVRSGKYTDEERYLSFQTLVRGFVLHLGAMEHGSERWSAAVTRFHEAVNNASLVMTLFGVDLTDKQTTP